MRGFRGPAMIFFSASTCGTVRQLSDSAPWHWIVWIEPATARSATMPSAMPSPTVSHAASTAAWMAGSLLAGMKLAGSLFSACSVQTQAADRRVQKIAGPSTRMPSKSSG